MAKEQHPNDSSADPDQDNPQPQRSGGKRDLGFGSKFYRKGVRLINSDGTFNVHRKGLPWFRPYDFYNGLIGMSWLKFLGLVFLFYFTVNLIFSLIYLMVGIEHLDGTMGATPFQHFLDAFFFSAQTITTLGYGRISPMGAPANIVAAIESLFGLLFFALVTGIMYGRFSRPMARIRFSKKILMTPWRDGHGLMFRIANMRSSELIEVEVQVVASMVDPKEKKRVFKPLELQISKINFLALSWTINHPVDEKSPLYDMDQAAIMACDPEFIILVKAFDDAFSQTVYQRFSYKGDEMVWNAKFESIIIPSDDKRITLELDQIDEYYSAQD